MLELPIITILLPFVIGAILFVMPKRWGQFCGLAAVVTSLAVLALTCVLFTKVPLNWPSADNLLFRVDKLSGFVALFIAFFAALVSLYSLGFMKGREALNQYYGLIMLTLAGSIGAALSNSLILLLVFWGFLGIALYLLILTGGPESTQAAKKTFIIVGGSDAVMLLGIAILWQLTGTFRMDTIRLSVDTNVLASAAFVCLALGAFAKAGAIPLHTWIPDSSEVAPASVMAFLPASLDKLLGIYLLARMSLEMFAITPGSGMSVFLMAVGAVTIIAAVMMALVQHNLKRLLAYHAVSQVGYMVLGIGTATPLGVAGGLFHMLNHAIYKSCLFLSGGSVEKEARTTELDSLGGLARAMPITFATCLVASLSISGVPPFNGFFSKWMIYQSVIETGKLGSRLWVVWLTVAMFGSGLTLASFMKLLYSTFLSAGQAAGDRPQAAHEAPAAMWLPQAILAALCVIFGVFAYSIPLRQFIAPSVASGAAISYPGVWNAPLATALMLAGIILGLVIFVAGKKVQTKPSDIFIGGEVLGDNSGIKATPFYATIKDMPLLKYVYNLADKKVFDIYEEGTKGTFFLTDILRWLHNGVLPTYLVWCLMGMLVLFFAFVR